MPRHTEFGLNSKESSPSREALNKHDMGEKRYQAKIDKGSKEASRKNLPFSFSKAHKESPRSVVCWCPDCERVSRVTKTTVMVECVQCKSLYSLTEDNTEP